MKRNLEYALLDSVEANTIGADRDLQTFDDVTIHIIATNVSVGATVVLESSLDGVHYVALETVEIVDDIVIEKVLTGVHKHIRASVSDYTDGTYSVLLLARG
jgi:uncharacterized protein YycO